MTNALFAPAGARIVEIQPRNFTSQWVWAASRCARAEWRGYVCASPCRAGPGGLAPSHPTGLPVRLRDSVGGLPELRGRGALTKKGDTRRACVPLKVQRVSDPSLRYRWPGPGGAEPASGRPAFRCRSRRRGDHRRPRGHAPAGRHAPAAARRGRDVRTRCAGPAPVRLRRGAAPGGARRARGDDHDRGRVHDPVRAADARLRRVRRGARSASTRGCSASTRGCSLRSGRRSRSRPRHGQRAHPAARSGRGARSASTCGCSSAVSSTRG
jgi:hypothetical protein